MIFTNAQCRLCGWDMFDIRQVRAFKIEQEHILPVDLKDQQPWSGLVIVCCECCNDIYDSMLGTT